MGKKLIIAHEEIDLKCLNTAAGGWTVKTAEDGNDALRLIQRFRSAVVAAVIDLDLLDEEGITFLRQMRRANPELPVIALMRSDRPEEVAEAKEAGATECAFKPIIHDEIVRILERVTKTEAVCRCEPVDVRTQTTQFVHLNPEMRAIQQSLRMLAPWNVPVIFLGETGVGKEVAARELHRLSTRAHKPFIKINCAAVPSELLESELFGYEKGAFTGAMRSKLGKFELADGGTILLDEIGDMHANLQAKLLQVLQDGEFDRLGGRQSIRVDVRVLAATHRDLRRAVEAGTFREDLFYRLNVSSIVIPPLRERKDEIVPLAEQFVVKHGKASGTHLPEIPMALRQALVGYSWPGNVRELENVVRKFLVFRQPDVLAAELWDNMAERAHAAPVPVPAKAHARASQPETLVRNGSNGAAVIESTKSYATSNGYGSAAVAGFGGPGRFPVHNGNGSEVSDERFGIVHRSNGKGGEADFGRLAVNREEEMLDASGDDYLDLEAEDNTPVMIPPADSRVQEIYSKSFQNTDSVSTLSQVEELSKEFERRTILAALQRSTWNRKKAAKLLEIDYKGLLYKMKKLQIA